MADTIPMNCLKDNRARQLNWRDNESVTSNSQSTTTTVQDNLFKACVPPKCISPDAEGRVLVVSECTTGIRCFDSTKSVALLDIHYLFLPSLLLINVVMQSRGGQQQKVIKRATSVQYRFATHAPNTNHPSIAPSRARPGLTWEEAEQARPVR